MPTGTTGTPALMAKPGRVIIRLGTPIATKEFSAAQKHELAARIHSEVARLISGPA
jgi:hypothetical protein